MAVKKNNHLYPALHIRKWESLGGYLLNKKTGKIRKIHNDDFTSRYYYSLGLEDDTLENRIQVFESYIGDLIKTIDGANQSVYLSGKDIEILKLYCVLSACRQHHTSEVIKEDESGYYSSNNYLFGIHRIKTQEEAVAITTQVMDSFDELRVAPIDKVFEHSHRIMNPKSSGSIHTFGTHIVIFRSENNTVMVSDVCSIIENTLDGDHLYTYVPISPKSALLLVKTKYYLDLNTFENTKERLARKHGGFKPDPYLSVILGGHKENYEQELFCSYYRYKLKVTVPKETYIVSNQYKSAFVKISSLPDFVFQQFNRIFYEDGEKILFVNNDNINEVKSIKLDYRYVTCG